MMKVTLSPRDTARWLSGGQEAWQVEESVLTWATDAHMVEPVVVMSLEGAVLFAFYVDETKAGVQATPAEGAQR